MKSKIIVFCGYSGAGKSSYAKLIRNKYSIPYLAKDDIKAFLYDNNFFKSRSIDIFKLMLSELIKNHEVILIDAALNYDADIEYLESLKIDGCELLSIVFVCERNERIRRIRNRERHKCHEDVDNNYIENHGLIDENFDYDRLPGEVHRINTEREEEDVLKDIARNLRCKQIIG